MLFFKIFYTGGFYLGRKRIDEDLRHENITISLPKYQIILLRKIKNYNKLIQDFLVEYFEKNKM